MTMNSEPSRLDRIEAILETMAHRDSIADSRLDNLTEKIDHLTDKIDHLTDKMDQLSKSQQDALKRQDYLDERVNNLVTAVATTHETLNVEISEFKSTFLATERRIEQIWEYLMAQLDNRVNGDGTNY